MENKPYGLSRLRPGNVGKANEETMSKLREPKAEKPEHEEGEKVHEIHEHGDGSFTTKMHDGTEEHHPDHMHLTAHIAHHMEPESKHFHTSHDGFSHRSHGIHETGEHTETHDHENLDELKNSMDQFLGEEGKEGHEEEQGHEETPIGGM